MQWNQVPDGVRIETDNFVLRVGHKMTCGTYAYFVWKKGEQNQYRGESHSRKNAKYQAVQLMKKLCMLND
jgi:hypothetical protein